jgi:hypothetical protein
LVGFHGLEMQVAEFQDNYIWIVKFNELKEEGQVFENIPKTEYNEKAEHINLNAWKSLPCRV